MLEEILKIHQAGDLDAAEQRYREWLAFNPDDPEALHLLAILRRQQGDLRESLSLAQKAVDLVPDRANYQLTIAGLLLHARDFGAAREAFTTALRLNPNLPGAALGIGQVALLQGDIDGAQEAVAKAERMAPEHPQVYAQKGSIAQARGDHDSAVKLFMAAVKRNPNDPAFQANLARSFSALGNTAFAEQALRNAVALKPNYTAAQVALAQLLMKERRPDEALAQFEAILSDQPEHPLARAGRGDLRRAQGDLAGALDDYRQAHSTAPALATIAAALIETLFATGSADEARTALSAALLQSPTSPELRRLDLKVAMQAGGDQPLIAVQAWAEADAGSTEAQDRLTSMLELRGRYDEADATARAMLARDSRAGFARLLLARSALRAGRPEDAQEQLNRVPDSSLPTARRVERAQLRGLSRDALGDHEGAVEAWLAGFRAQSGLAPLVSFPALATLADTLPPAVAASGAGPAPTFLIGLPGAGCESLVTALRPAGVRVLGDRFGRRMRRDAISTGGFAAMFATLKDDASQADVFRDQYLAGLASVDEVVAPGLVDWLPFLDLRLATMIQAAFPDARYLLTTRDLRDCLLSWLARGTAQALAMPDPAGAGAWLAAAQSHLDAARERIPAPAVLEIGSALLAEPALLARRACEFLGLPAPVDLAFDAGVLSGRGGLPTRLPDGRWQAYSTPLKEAFAALG